MELGQFTGTERFELRRRLGAGTAGIVYEAWDHERSALVALKILHQSDAGGLYRDFGEFRRARHVMHRGIGDQHGAAAGDDHGNAAVSLF